MRIDKPKLKFYVLIFLIITVVIVSLIFHAKGYHIDLAKYLDNLKSNPNLPIIYLLLYFISSFFPLPFLTLFGATIFPFHKVFILSMIGNTLSFVILFYLTRWLGRDYVEIYEDKNLKLKSLDFKVRKNAFLYIFLLRLFFIIPPEAINVFAGLSRMKFKDYLTASVLGTIPVVIFSIALVKSYQMKSFQLLLISVIIFALCMIIPLIFIKGLRRYFRKEKIEIKK
jgi:uncharacterized membrane protein YdjX (TVP38/TMEM64 family)